jgi:hypothetical protein
VVIYKAQNGQAYKVAPLKATVETSRLLGLCRRLRENQRAIKDGREPEVGVEDAELIEAWRACVFDTFGRNHSATEVTAMLAETDVYGDDSQFWPIVRAMQQIEDDTEPDA